MKRLWICLAMLTCCAVPVLTQTTQELVNDGKNTENVTTQSMGYDRKSYSPLKQINKSNVKRLVPIWSTSLMNDQGELAAPTIYNGVMYVINGKWTFAIDVETGRQIWRTPVELEPGITARCAFNRGAATIYNGKLFRVTIDNHRARARHEDRQGSSGTRNSPMPKRATTPPARRSSPTAC